MAPYLHYDTPLVWRTPHTSRVATPPPAPGSATLSVDPGVRYAALAWWDGSDLVRTGRAAWSDGRRREGALAVAGVGAAGLDRLVSEWPQSYPGERVAESDLVGLRRTVQAIEAAVGLDHVWRCRPNAWKGHVPKDVHAYRIREALTPDEVARVDWSDRDVADAVGVGLWFLGRTGRGGVRV